MALLHDRNNYPTQLLEKRELSDRKVGQSWQRNEAQSLNSAKSDSLGPGCSSAYENHLLLYSKALALIGHCHAIR